MNRDQPVRIWAAPSVRYGRGAAPPGVLSAFSVGSEREAEALITLTCSRNPEGQFVASELTEEETVGRLFAFSRKLKQMHDQFLKNTPRCICSARFDDRRVRGNRIARAECQASSSARTGSTSECLLGPVANAAGASKSRSHGSKQLLWQARLQQEGESVARYGRRQFLRAGRQQENREVGGIAADFLRERDAVRVAEDEARHQQLRPEAVQH